MADVLDIAPRCYICDRVLTKDEATAVHLNFGAFDERNRWEWQHISDRTCAMELMRQKGRLIDETLRLNAALAEAIADRRWLPIETAPRDGSWMLCWDPESEVDIMRWYAWSAARGEWQSSEGVRTEPTHWQPLPAPPSEGEGK